MLNYKTFRKEYRRKSLACRATQKALRLDQKTRSLNRKYVRPHKILKICCVKDPAKRLKRQGLPWRSGG